MEQLAGIITHILPKKGELLDRFFHLYNSQESYSVLNSIKGFLSRTVFLPPCSFILEHLQIMNCFKGVDKLS